MKLISAQDKLFADALSSTQNSLAFLRQGLETSQAALVENAFSKWHVQSDAKFLRVGARIDAHEERISFSESQSQQQKSSLDKVKVQLHEMWQAMVELQAPVASTIPGDLGDWACSIDYHVLRVNTPMAISFEAAKAAIRPLVDRASL